MATVSFSIDDQTNNLIKEWAKEAGTSKSDVLRDMTKEYTLRRQWLRIQEAAQASARRHGLKTEDDIEEFLG